MNIRRVSGIAIAVIGVGLYLFGSYIENQVNEGKDKISNAQKKVNQSRGLTGLSPYTKGIGNTVADSAQKKIDAGEQEVTKYEKLADQLHMGGIAVVVVGAGLFLISFIHRPSKK